MRIVKIHKRDAWFGDRDWIVGELGTVENVTPTLAGYVSCEFYPSNKKAKKELGLDYFYFAYVQIEDEFLADRLES